MRRSGRIATGRWEWTVCPAPRTPPCPRRPAARGCPGDARPCGTPAHCSQRCCSSSGSRNRCKQRDEDVIRDRIKITVAQTKYPRKTSEHLNIFEQKMQTQLLESLESPKVPIIRTPWFSNSWVREPFLSKQKWYHILYQFLKNSKFSFGSYCVNRQDTHL